MTASEATIAPLIIYLFGPMQVLVEARPLPHLRSRKAQWLLALLTLRHDRPVEREWLAGTLWPDVDQSQAFANLRPTLSELRKVLGNQGERLRSPNRHTLLLDLAGTEVDVHAFDTAMASKKQTELERAIALYRGPLLEGCTEEWVGQERNVREQQCLSALEQLADTALVAGNHAIAVDYYQRAVRLNPLWDTARRGLMQAFARSGDSNAALQVYREFVELLRSDPNGVPDHETTALYQRLRTESRQRASTPVVMATAPVAKEVIPPAVSGYLPHPVTELIGREDERIEVAARLRRSRLVTLTGLGGIGKTRLAIEVAAEVVQDYPYGAWLVSLESLSEGRLVTSRIASVLGLKEESGRSVLQSVTDHLRNKRLLLVLDNCEHLLQPIAQIGAHLLQECAGVRILATSREALGIPGETSWAVPALAMPDLEHLPKGQSTLQKVLMGYESIQLFVERAQAVQQGFALTGSNALAIAEVCSRLEGIPLAIELAAARVKAMTVEQVAVRLNDLLNLLTDGTQTTRFRQQTLRAAMDWSYDLLSEQERLLLGRLSVFVGGCSLEAAEHICQDSGLHSTLIQNSSTKIESEAVLDLLASLVDKSLVAFEERDAGIGGRYRLSETVRQYAAERLQTSGETLPIQVRHRDWFVSFAEEAESQLQGAQQETWLARLSAEYDNLRAALTCCETEPMAAESSLRLAGALYRFWYVRGYWGEGQQYLKQALEQEKAQADTPARAKALHGAGSLAYSQGDYASARTLLEESLRICREVGDPQGIAASLRSLGNVAYDQGNYASAWALHAESLTIHRQLGDRQGIAWSLNSLANIAHPQGEYASAKALYEESLDLFRKLGDRQGTARSLNCLGYVAYDQGDYVVARVLFEEALALFQELDDRGGIAWSFSCLGYASYDQGDYTSAQKLLGESLSLFKELGDRRGVAWALNSLGNAACDQGEFASSHALHEESLQIRHELGDQQGMAWSLNCLGNAALESGDYVSARGYLAESLGLFKELGDRKGVAESLGRLAAVLQAQGQTNKAVWIWGATHTLRESIGAPLSLKDRQKYDSKLRKARFALGEAAFAAAWEEGLALPWEQAVSDAIAEILQK